jgi:hypothetical protein
MSFPTRDVDGRIAYARLRLAQHATQRVRDRPDAVIALANEHVTEAMEAVSIYERARGGPEDWWYPGRPWNVHTSGGVTYVTDRS